MENNEHLRTLPLSIKQVRTHLGTAYVICCTLCDEHAQLWDIKYKPNGEMLADMIEHAKTHG